MSGARRVLVGASFAYLCNAVPAAWLSLRDDLAAAPFGIRTGLDARGDLTWGIGSALCAPPPMLVALGVLASKAARTGSDDRGRIAALIGLGSAFICGMAAEPVAREVLADPRAHPEWTAVVLANIVLPAAMVAAGLVHLARSRNDLETSSQDHAGADERSPR